MSGGHLPPEVADLIARHLDSVVRLEVLLHLYQHAGVAHTAESVARELRIDPAWAQGQLIELNGRGFVTKDTSTTPVFKYEPAEPGMAKAVDALAKTFVDRRVAVIAAIYSQPPDPLRSFTDAFRIRKERDSS